MCLCLYGLLRSKQGSEEQSGRFLFCEVRSVTVCGNFLRYCTSFSEKCSVRLSAVVAHDDTFYCTHLKTQLVKTVCLFFNFWY